MQALFRDSSILVAEDSDRIAGFRANRGSFATWFFVHPAFRPQGSGGRARPRFARATAATSHAERRG